MKMKTNTNRRLLSFSIVRFEASFPIEKWRQAVSVFIFLFLRLRTGTWMRFCSSGSGIACLSWDGEREVNQTSVGVQELFVNWIQRAGTCTPLTDVWFLKLLAVVTCRISSKVSEASIRQVTANSFQALIINFEEVYVSRLTWDVITSSKSWCVWVRGRTPPGTLHYDSISAKLRKVNHNVPGGVLTSRCLYLSFVFS